MTEVAEKGTERQSICWYLWHSSQVLEPLGCFTCGFGLVEEIDTDLYPS